MFTLPNLSQAINNFPQMSILAKYGIFQSSSFTSVKKITELDVVYGELGQTLNLIKDIKYERLLHYLSYLKYGAGFKASEWLNNEDFFRFSKRRQKNYITSINKCEETVESSIDSDKIYSEKYLPIGYNCCSTSSTIDQNPDLLQQTKTNDLQCIINENKQFLSITSHLISNLNDSNHSIFKNSYFYACPGRGTHLLLSYNRNYQGQKRGFKTQRQLEVEYEKSLWGFLKQLKKKFGSNSEPVSKESTVNPSAGKQPKAHPLGVVSFYVDFTLSILRIICLIAVIFFFKEVFVRVSLENYSGTVNVLNANVTFDDAKGMEEAKAELKHVVEYLRNPTKFQNLGGKLPSGILLQGPPGTGKTLLARAIAGEAKVNFFHVNGSEFDEIFVGEGARRIRSLFALARKNAPAVLFIDEIDAIGEKRVSHSLQPHANQTIIQLLTEMDGFVKNDRIIVIGATNRDTDLDEALLRPGRFDSKITLRKPTLAERKDILQLYVDRVVSKNIDVEFFAKRAAGFTGAELENLVNQAALLAATEGCNHVGTEHMDRAFDRILLGPVMASIERTKDMDKLTAYHESGHAVVAYFTPGGNLPVKVTITPRGESLGHTALIRDEKYLRTKSDILAAIDVSMGGRAAEELIFGAANVTVGCSEDLQQATRIATDIVKCYGMSEKGGLRIYNTRPRRAFEEKEYGQKAADETDEEIKKIIQESYERAKETLKKHSVELELLADRLLEKETLDSEEIKNILSQSKKSN